MVNWKLYIRKRRFPRDLEQQIQEYEFRALPQRQTIRSIVNSEIEKITSKSVWLFYRIIEFEGVTFLVPKSCKNIFWDIKPCR
jgi:hypothetical protein